MLHVLVIFALSHKIQGGGVVQIYFTLILIESRQIQTTGSRISSGEDRSEF